MLVGWQLEGWRPFHLGRHAHDFASRLFFTVRGTFNVVLPIIRPVVDADLLALSECVNAGPPEKQLASTRVTPRDVQLNCWWIDVMQINLL